MHGIHEEIERRVTEESIRIHTECAQATDRDAGREMQRRWTRHDGIFRPRDRIRFQLVTNEEAQQLQMQVQQHQMTIRAYTALREGNFDETLRCLTEAFRINPSSCQGELETVRQQFVKTLEELNKRKREELRGSLV